jgi:hypothetical protein
MTRIIKVFVNTRKGLYALGFAYVEEKVRFRRRIIEVEFDINTTDGWTFSKD